MLAGHLALTVAALFSGAAFYVNFAEHPARMHLDNRGLLLEWKPAYKRGFLMQGPLAVLGFLLGLVAWWQSGSWYFLVGAVVLLANWPFTLLVIMPTNERLMATEPATAGSEVRALLEKWNKLHAVRTTLGVATAVLFLIALQGW